MPSAPEVTRAVPTSDGTQNLRKDRRVAVPLLRYHVLTREQGGASRGGRYRKVPSDAASGAKNPGPGKMGGPTVLLTRNATGEPLRSSECETSERRLLATPERSQRWTLRPVMAD